MRAKMMGDMERVFPPHVYVREGGAYSNAEIDRRCRELAERLGLTRPVEVRQRGA